MEGQNNKDEWDFFNSVLDKSQKEKKKITIFTKEGDKSFHSVGYVIENDSAGVKFYNTYFNKNQYILKSIIIKVEE